MDLPSHFVRLAGNNLWSNHRLLAACRALGDEEYFAPRQSFFGSIHAALDHILLVDLLYLDRLRGSSTVAADCERLTPDLGELSRRQSAIDRELLAFCEEQDAGSLDARVSFTRADGQRYSDTVGDILGYLGSPA